MMANSKDELPLTFEDGWKKLEEELLHEIESPEPNSNGELPLKYIALASAVFQPRSFENDSVHKSESHISSLMDGIISSPDKKLNPIVVWWSGKCFRVLDGHHRLEAYKRLKQGNKLKRDAIPVEVFKGDLNGAFEESIKRNSFDKMPMSKADKLERTWKMVCLDAFSKSTINTATTISTTTIANMRTKLKELQDEFGDTWKSEVLSITWEEVLSGKKRTEYTDDWQEKQAMEWAKRLGKALGSKPVGNPLVFARAVEIYSEDLANSLKEYWAFDSSEPEF